MDSKFSFIHKIDRFIDLVDEQWVNHQLPIESLFPNVGEFGDSTGDLDIEDENEKYKWTDFGLTEFSEKKK